MYVRAARASWATYAFAPIHLHTYKSRQHINDDGDDDCDDDDSNSNRNALSLSPSPSLALYFTSRRTPESKKYVYISIYTLCVVHLITHVHSIEDSKSFLISFTRFLHPVIHPNAMRAPLLGEHTKESKTKMRQRERERERRRKNMKSEMNRTDQKDRK